MKKLCVAVCVVVGLVATTKESRADGLEDYSASGRTVHHVREGASGDGTSWGNAFGALPTPLQRGHVYFVADGTYTFPDLDTPEASNQTIYIVKATETDHGSASGWLSEYGDGVATTTSFSVDTGHWVIDGQTRTSGTSGHGFKVVSTGSCSGSQEKLIVVDGPSVSLAYLELEHCGYSYPGSQDCLFLRNAAQDAYVGYSWMHNVNRVHIYSLYNTGLTVEHTWFTERYNADSYAVHGESFTVYGDQNAMGHVWRYNTFRNVEGTGVLVIQNTGSGGYDIYGNVFYNDADHVADGQTSGDPAPTTADFDCSNGVIADTGAYVNSNVNVFNNTFVDLPGQSGIAVSNAGNSGIVVRNNLWVNCGRVVVEADTASDNTENGNSELFRDYANHDYVLAQPTRAGFDLGPPYDRDMLDSTRGADGQWDRGAFEYPPSAGGAGGGGAGGAGDGGTGTGGSAGAAGGGAGTGGGSDDGGVGGSGGVDGGSLAPPTSEDDSGCSCRLVGPQRTARSSAVWWLLVGARASAQGSPN